MALSDFYPFKKGQVVTPEQWNELFEAIRNGTFFLNNNDPLTEQISNLASQINILKQEVEFLRQYVKDIRFERENFQLSNLQNRVTLSYQPILFSEIVILNNTVLTRKINANEEVWDYYMDGKNIIFNPTLSVNIEEGDILSVVYRRL